MPTTPPLPTQRKAAGFLYTINNDTNENAVVVLKRKADGTLTEVPGSPFRTGGKGLSGGDIDQQGAICVHGNFVIAVNPGSDSVAVLRKGDGGKLTPVAGSPFASGGPAPLSIAAHKGLVYVANQAPPFANPKTAPNVTGFRIDRNGKLQPIAKSKIAFPKDHGPAQIAFNPSGKIVVVTSGFQDAETSRVHSFKVQPDSTLKKSPGSPVRPAGASGPVGFSWNAAGNRVYVSNFRRSSIIVFDVDPKTGSLTQNGAAHPTDGSAACWTALSADGKTLYTANFASNTISGFNVRDDGKLVLLGSVDRRGAGDPDTKDMVLSKDGRFLYAVASLARQIAIFKIDAQRGLTELPAGKSPAKIKSGQQILGLTTD
ncbi:MAG TPA: beta-propeller fold lactonase family protein [Chthoniobacterales bacterium]|nr:beta-propeller fold lactonase family protein [Chthoniobacterales bacterium]